MSSTQNPSATEPGCNISSLPAGICVDEIEAEYNDLIEEARLCLDQLQKAQSQLEDEVMGHQNTREEKEGLEGELRVVKGEKEGLEGELRVVKGEKEGLEGELRVVKEEKEGLEGELRVVKEEKEGLEGELRVVKGEKEGLEGELRVVKEEKEGLEGELRVVKEEKEGLEGELADSRQDAQLCLLQLSRVQEELERYFLESRDLENHLIRQGEKLHWLRGQRELLIRMVRLQGVKLRAFVAMDGRIALPALKRQCQPWWQRIARL